MNSDDREKNDQFCKLIADVLKPLFLSLLSLHYQRYDIIAVLVIIDLDIIIIIIMLLMFLFLIFVRLFTLLKRYL